MLAATASAPGFWDWSLDAPLVIVIDLAILYRLGDRRTVRPMRTRGAQHLRSAAFYGSLIVLAIALSSPLDILSDDLFWAHMVQHVLLMLVAAPLMVLARPWVRLWRSVPLTARRRIARTLSRDQRAAPLRTVVRALGRPATALVAFTATLAVWHVPVMFDATLRSAPLHALEHTLFFLTAVALFKHVIDSPPLRSPLDDPRRILFTTTAMVVSWALAVVLALAPHPLYGHYAALASRPGGISALADQQIAAGVMWVPGSVTFVLVIFAYIHRWLARPTGGAARREPRLAGGH